MPCDWLSLQISLEALDETDLYVGSSPVIGLSADALARNRRHVVLAGSIDRLCERWVVDGILCAIEERCEIRDRTTWVYQASYFRDLISCFSRNQAMTGWVAIIPRWRKFASRQLPTADVSQVFFDPARQVRMKDVALRCASGSRTRTRTCRARG